MYKQQKTMPQPETFKCPECSSNRFLYNFNKIQCTECGHVEKGSAGNKFGAKKQVANDGMKRDSTFEAKIADILLLRKKGNDIKDYDSQYKVEIWIYREDGTKAFKVQHKVDFRIHHNDGSFELYEAKGVETDDYKWRRRCLEELWLPLNLDHIYTVVKDKNNFIYGGARSWGKKKRMV